MSSPFVSSERQLVVEVTVCDLARSIAFYRSIGFKLIRAEGHFAEMGWENSKLLLDERTNYIPPSILSGNIRVLVPNVAEHWAKCNELGVAIYSTIADKYYGLRDFTVLDPDGFGIRFATDIPMPGHS